MQHNGSTVASAVGFFHLTGDTAETCTTMTVQAMLFVHKHKTKALKLELK